MLIWLLHIGEPVPGVDGAVRKYRCALLAENLVKRGHKVVQWLPTFEDSTRRYRYKKDVDVEINANFLVKFIHSGGYFRHIGFRRWLFHRKFARKFLSSAKKICKPDIIVTAIPTIETCNAVRKFARKFSIPYIVDIRDLWPDLYFQCFPKGLRWFSKIVFTPTIVRTKRFLTDATAICAISQEYLDMGLRYANRTKKNYDNIFYIGFSGNASEVAEEKIVVAQKFWDDLGLDDKQFICVFAGTFYRSVDLLPIICAAQKLPMIKFVCCGDGDDASKYLQAAKNIKNVCFPGWVDSVKLEALYARSSVALAAYSSSATMSLPNKPFDYLAAGLPIVSSLHGELKFLLDKYRAGYTYDANDAEQLVEVLEKLYFDRSLLLAVKESAKHMFMEIGDADKIYNDFVDYLEKIIRK